MEISVIICSHNPRENLIARTFETLRAQSLALHRWELIIVDNASTPPLAERTDVSWHPHARVVPEQNLGLTPARLRGIRETHADLLVFVDDDNVLRANYLEHALEIANTFSFLGAWGGQIVPEFETEPPKWCVPYLECLALRSFKRDLWGNFVEKYDAVPFGAGLCVRRNVAEAYARNSIQSPIRRSLDRKGAQLFSAGDTDFALTACDLGLGTGVFTRLHLTHLIPSARLSLEYFEKLVEGAFYSEVLLRSLRGEIVTVPRTKWPRALARSIRNLTTPRETRVLKAAEIRGRRRGIAAVTARAVAVTMRRGTRVPVFRTLTR